MNTPKKKQEWSVYMLSNDRRTYIGSTTDPLRRLRQHNGEIVGGARSTRSGRPWHLVQVVSGFRNRSEACRWERIVKCRARGYFQRLLALNGVKWGICPHGRGRKRSMRKYLVPGNLYFGPLK